MEDTFNDSEFVEAKRNYRGFKMKAEVNEWLSVALDRPAIMLRSADERLRSLDPARLITSIPTDRRSTFKSDAALHVVNLNSCRELKQRILARNPTMNAQDLFVE